MFISYNIYLQKHSDSEGPIISMDSDTIEISVEDKKAALLQGVTAYDNKDGDVTASVGIESLSDFDEDGYRIVHYVAFDSNNNVSKKSRKMKYRDYKKIVFSLDSPLRFPAGQGNTDVLGAVHAEDCLDGNISNQIGFSEQSIIYTSVPSDYPVTLVVTNSAGDTAILPVTVTMYDAIEEREAPKISLTNYLVYTKVGDEINPKDYIEGIEYNRVEYLVTDGRGTYDIDTSEMSNQEKKAFYEEEPSVNIDRFMIGGSVDYYTPGVYEVKYYIDSPEEFRGTVNLVVVVEGE